VATGNDIVTGALRCINAYGVGQPLDPGDAQDALGVVNQLLESLSIEHFFVYSTTENILSWNPGQFQYTIGAPALGTPGASFTANLTSGSPTFTVSSVPANLMAGAAIADSAGAIPAGTKVLNASGTTVTMTANASANANADLVTYSGFFNIPLPTRIVSGFTRLVTLANLDYPFNLITQGQYQNIGIKNLPGPWPTAVYYDRQYPIGMLYVYKVPQIGGELHLWTDYIFSAFANLNQVINAPQGYTRMLIYNLAVELAPRYGRPVTPDLMRLAKESKATIKALNQRPTQDMMFEQGMGGERRVQDAGFILHGGFSS
jgi:hypothetical protein